MRLNIKKIFSDNFTIKGIVLVLTGTILLFTLFNFISCDDLLSEAYGLETAKAILKVRIAEKISTVMIVLNTGGYIFSRDDKIKDKYKKALIGTVVFFIFCFLLERNPAILSGTINLITSMFGIESEIFGSTSVIDRAKGFLDNLL